MAGPVNAMKTQFYEDGFNAIHVDSTLDVQLPSVKVLLIAQSKVAYNRNHKKNLTHC